MAINTKSARKEAERKRKDYEYSYKQRLCSFYDNAVDVENLPNDLPKRYLLRILREQGAIAYDKITGLFLPFTEIGIDVYGLPTGYDLIGFNGFVVHRVPNEVVILRANDVRYPIAHYFDIQIQKLIDYDLAIEQNLDAIRTMTICEVEDEKTLLSIVNEYESRRIGATVVYKNTNSGRGNKIGVQSTGATYLVDKLLEARKEVFNETLSTIGINVANVDKRERVQVAEIEASQGYAIDSINTLIDTFNHDAEVGGLSVRLKGNTSLIFKDDLINNEGDEENE